MKADSYIRLLKIFIEGYEKILDADEEKGTTWESTSSILLTEEVADDIEEIFTYLYDDNAVLFRQEIKRLAINAANKLAMLADKAERGYW